MLTLPDLDCIVEGLAQWNSTRADLSGADPTQVSLEGNNFERISRQRNEGSAISLLRLAGQREHGPAYLRECIPNPVAGGSVRTSRQVSLRLCWAGSAG